MADQSQREFKVSCVSRDETDGAMLVSGDLERVGGGIVLRLSPADWMRIAQAAAAFARQQVSA
jgi:hypothetical protein